MAERVAIVDYGSGNLHSAAKAFHRVAPATGAEIEVTRDPEAVRRADRVMIPGVGAFADCAAGLAGVPGLREAITERVMRDGVPCLGVCVGLQLFADLGRERGVHEGLGWVPGEVVALRPKDPSLKVPHMGWNVLKLRHAHPVLADLGATPFVYFVHSFHFETIDESHTLAISEYGQEVAAVIGRENLIGTQFHPEKSQRAGLRLIENFLRWRP